MTSRAGRISDPLLEFGTPGRVRMNVVGAQNRGQRRNDRPAIADGERCGRIDNDSPARGYLFKVPVPGIALFPVIRPGGNDNDARPELINEHCGKRCDLIGSRAGHPGVEYRFAAQFGNVESVNDTVADKEGTAGRKIFRPLFMRKAPLSVGVVRFVPARVAGRARHCSAKKNAYKKQYHRSHAALLLRHFAFVNSGHR